MGSVPSASSEVRAERVPPLRPTLRRRYLERRARVIQIAAELFAERGYRETTIDDLVIATGLQRGGLYHYIESKQALLLMIHDELMEPLLERAEIIVRSHGSPEEQLRQLIHVWVEQVATHRAHMTVFSEERRLIESDPDWRRAREQRQSFQEMLGDVLRRGVGEGAFAITDIELTERLVLGVVNHLSSWFDPDGRVSAEEVADTAADLVLHGLARPA